jgi:hypothetical protein
VGCRKHSPGQPCCDCVDPCGTILEESLPNISISGMTGGSWISLANCCWQKTFTYNELQLEQFSDGGALQTDNWTTVANYSLTTVKRSRGDIAVQGQVRRVDSGGPYDPVDVGDADWRPDGYEIVPPTKPDCPTCVTANCLTRQVTRFKEYMQRWGVKYKNHSIVVAIQRVKVVCDDNPEACEYVMSSKQRYQILPIFGEFIKTQTTDEWVAFDCCEIPGDALTVDLVDYPDFDDPSVYNFETASSSTDFNDAYFFDVVSIVKLNDITPQSVTFGPDICTTCESTYVAFCLGPCTDGCITTSGSGEVHNRPLIPEYGLDGTGSMCTSLTSNSVTCSFSFNVGFQCEDYYWVIFDDDLTICTRWGATTVDCGTPTYTHYRFDSLSCPFYVPWYDQYAPLGPSPYGEDCSVDPPTPSTCLFPNTNLIAANVQTMTGLTYSATCSGPLEQEVCLGGSNWTVTIS